MSVQLSKPGAIHIQILRLEEMDKSDNKIFCNSPISK